jgi:hypothetical protein
VQTQTGLAGFSRPSRTISSTSPQQYLPVLVEHLDERTPQFSKATDRVEIRITGPFTQEISAGYHRVLLDANVLLTSRYDGQAKNAYTILKLAGAFHAAMDGPIPVWNYGNEPGDYTADPATQVFLGCLTPRAGRNDAVSVHNFGQTDLTDKLKQTAVDARYVMYLTE